MLMFRSQSDLTAQAQCVALQCRCVRKLHYFPSVSITVIPSFFQTNKPTFEKRFQLSSDVLLTPESTSWQQDASATQFGRSVGLFFEMYHEDETNNLRFFRTYWQKNNSPTFYAYYDCETESTSSDTTSRFY